MTTGKNFAMTVTVRVSLSEPCSVLECALMQVLYIYMCIYNDYIHIYTYICNVCIIIVYVYYHAGIAYTHV